MRYVVLRDLASPRPGSYDRIFQNPIGSSSFSPPLPEVSLVDIDRREHHELVRDPKVVSIAPPMPLALIAPVATADSASVPGPTWGVNAVCGSASTFTGKGTTVAVLDTGIDAAHDAFANVDIVQRDFTGEGDGDVVGHGTHCAGTIVGRDVNGTRIGVARGVEKLLVGKVLGPQGGTTEALFAGIQWASDAGADVISMSLGFDFPGLVAKLTTANWPVDLATSSALEAYRANLRYFDRLLAMLSAREGMAQATGSVVVAASGNESKRNIDPNYEISASLPAAAEGIISVGALGPSTAGLVVAPFSNTNPAVCAPGVDVTSAKVGGGLVTMSGTSMACPHAAGVAALWWEMVRGSGLPAVATTVAARLQATTTLGALAAGVDISDRGQGLVQAPT